MNHQEYKAFCGCRDRFRAITEAIQRQLPELREIQQALIERDGYSYCVDTSVVYNAALDEVGADADIRLILVGDNPGRREQMAENRRYLVGPSGKIAENFFRQEPALAIDFRKNVIILNKTPVHTPRTAGLKDLCALGGEKIERGIRDSQVEMARLLADFSRALRVPIWITGYSEMKKRGIFGTYTAEIQNLIQSGLLDKNSIFLYRHFSMNQFTIDLRQKARLYGLGTAETLHHAGTEYRERILGI
ncbi:MAG: uracil-DNA glycosylase family protein [Spirochaetaceae bacterium]|nr:uracil-DNA glycosylase family protein [Spirochaetaceae bacterium]